MNPYETALALYTSARNGEDCTVDTWNHPLPTTGYYVGGEVESLVYKRADDIDRGELGWFVGDTESRYFGVWVDQNDKRIYFDASTHVESLEEAIFLANRRGELAVWDIAEGDELRVNQDQGYQDPEAAV